MTFKTELSKIAVDADKILNEMIVATPWDAAPANCSRYAALDAGKRLRAFLTVQAAGLFNVPYDSALRAGCCVEMVHNFSLIHDDLPCIDNDVLRRGRASVWAKYGERNAVLAGDFLLNWPYKILATDTKISADPATRIELIKILSEMTDGMLLGEWMDCEAEDGKFQSDDEIAKIQDLKTGCLFNACVAMGAALGNAGADERAALKKFADAMGLCFQITDDILDATGDESKVGKTLRKDATAGKATFVSLLGLDGARAKAIELVAIAKSALDIFDGGATLSQGCLVKSGLGQPRPTDALRGLMDYMVSRES